MKSHILLSLLATTSSASSPFLFLRDIGSNTVVGDDGNGGIDIDRDIIGKTVLEIVPDGPNMRKRETLESHGILGREAGSASPPKPAPTMTNAGRVSKLSGPGRDQYGVFFRGDSRPPSEIFDNGFHPKGDNLNLHEHLSFNTEGKSAFVSLSRSQEAAERYALRSSRNGVREGYVYAVAAYKVPDGYWIPENFDPILNTEVGANQEFAVPGNVLPQSISYGYKVTKKEGRVIQNPKEHNNAYIRRTGGCFSFRKRELTCDKDGFEREPADWGKSPKKGPLTKTGKRPVGVRVSASEFVDFLNQLNPIENLQPLVDGIRRGEITVALATLALKRTISETIMERYADFEDFPNAVHSITHICFDIWDAYRFKGVAPAFWGAVLKKLPAISKEIGQGRTPQERLEIANRNLLPSISIWESTPAGRVNEDLMRKAANERLGLESLPVAANKLWSYSPLGWLVNSQADIEGLIRRVIKLEELQ